jgi:hypothetical protein
MPLPAGDLRRESFAQVWNESELFRALRRGDVGGKCGRCEYRTICGGCRARAYSVDGDYLAADPSCLYEPEGTRPVIAPAHAVTYGAPAEAELPWTAEAEARIKRVPSFVRGVVVKRVEDYARRGGHTEITADLMLEVRQEMPVDFSKKLPFFIQDD